MSQDIEPDMQPMVQCEVLVPRIVFVAGQAENKKADEPMEHVSINPLLPRSSSTPPAFESLQGTASTYTTHKGVFRLFRISAIPALGQKLLLQIARRGSRRWSKRQSRQERDQWVVTDELAFTLAFSHSTSEYTATPLELIPGLNQVTIVLSEEGIPANYSIDGATH